MTMLFVIPFSTQAQSNKHDLILSFVISYLGDWYVCFQIDRQYYGTERGY